MPKPKRRPPVVKTDWVVMAKPNEHTDHVVFGTCENKKEAKERCKFWNRFHPVAYQRKWRKVDL